MKTTSLWALRLSIVGAAWVTLLSVTPHSLLAEEDTVPSWRRGVSQWNGSGYDLPADVPLSTATPADAPPLPYTMPVDPTVSATTKSNPYVGSATENSENIMDLTLPDPAAAAGNTLGGKSNASGDNGQDSGGAGDTSAMPLLDPPLTTSMDPSSADDSTAVEALDLTSQTDSLPHKSAAQTMKDGSEEEIEELPPPDGFPIDAEAGEAKKATSDLADKVANETSEAAPLESEVIRWYQYPRRWMRGWDSHAEFGIDGSSGNADTLALQTGLELKRKSELHTLAIDVDYRQASNRSKIIEDNGRFNVDYDRLLRESPWAGFGKFGLEWDKFKAFNLRVNLNGGVGYHWIRQDDTTLVTRFGAGASQEIGAPDDDWIAEAVFGVEAERQLTSRQKIKGKVDYFPAWENFGNYRLVSDVAWEILLDGSENLSLKLAATDRYDSTPQGAEANDVYYSLLLLYKF